MSKNGVRIEMAIGLLLMGLTLILRRFAQLNGLIYYAMVIVAVILIMVGIFHMFRSMGKNVDKSTEYPYFVFTLHLRCLPALPCVNILY